MLWFVLIGLGAGVLSGMFGVGGGVVIVPSLILAAHMAPQRATGTSLAALLLPVGALGVWQFYKAGSVDFRIAGLVAAGILVGAFFGSKIALAIPPRDLQRAFSVFLILVAVRMWWKA